MAVVFPNIGELYVLDTFIANWGTVNLFLYTSNTTPVAGSVYGDFSLNTYSWADPIDVSAEFAAASTDGSGKAASAALEQVWTCDGNSETFYGWGLATSGGVLICAEKFSSSVTVSVNGQEFRLTPTLTAVSE